MEKDRGETWFVQERRWQRPYPVHWKGWAAGVAFIVAFFAIAAFFISLQPFAPMNVGLLALWWLSILALMAGFHMFARSRTQRRWLVRTKDA